MRGNFDRALAATLLFEGGYSNHPDDPGGPTNHGITIATLSHELGRAASIDDVRHLSLSLAGSIYRRKYWNVIHADQLPSGVDALAFDICVNSGPGRILPWLAATAHLDPAERIARLDRYRRGFWRSLKTFRVFGRGWIAREDVLLRLAQSLCDAASPNQKELS